MERHRYGTELTENDPLAPQPTKIRVPLKPHQRAALAKAMKMEQDGCVEYRVTPPLYETLRFPYIGNIKIKTNVGIIGDLVGYGKTLTALSIIASTPSQDIFRDNENIYSFHGRHISKFTAICERPEVTASSNVIHTTLAIVPRGPVYMQWLRAIQTQTNMKVLSLDTLPTIRRLCPGPGSSIAVLKAYFEQYDIILIKSTTLKSLMDYYDVPFVDNPITSWDRIMIDEAHDILNKIPLFDYRFLWLITATYDILPSSICNSRNYMSNTLLRDIVIDDNLPFLLLKGNTRFVRNSFAIPDMTEHYYICRLPPHLSAIQPFLSQSANERLNANDIAGAIREMGGKNETESDLLELVTKDIQKEIRNKELEYHYVESLEIANDLKEQRLQNIQAEMKRLEDRLQSITERVSQLSSKACGICYENFDNPILLPCTHIFCGKCLIQWMKTRPSCPECRNEVKSKELIAVVQQKRSDDSLPQILDKVDTLLRIISEKPNGRFLIFSRVDSTFHRLMMALMRERITHAEIKGSTTQMMKILENFQNGHLRVILLNTRHAGSGIDISCATDVVIFHKMASDKVQAVGRAQRVGRMEPLHVHNLCYPHEMDSH
jgi:SNF2 family DNA or RNA helicase